MTDPGRIKLLVCAVLAVGLLVAASASAQAPEGPPEPAAPPYITPPGDNLVVFGSGNNTFRGTPLRDFVRFGPGNDRANVRGGGRDVVNCGGGSDRVIADRGDLVRRNCEFINGRRRP